ncbi:hypothetical protein BROUX41_002603 [Berkeleyomyces rouxiae]|uniref:uncharacterized protein n=1 Tax=Berkeleyomyces rouxiae TaxID=2035830 RepID=UPI003B805FB5
MSPPPPPPPPLACASSSATTTASLSFTEPAPADTPPEMPGTPTSTTTSLSAISTIATKDGQRGYFAGANSLLGRGHAHSPSTTSLEAERAERISRLAGLERVSTLRAPPYASHYNNNNNSGSTGAAAAGSDMSVSAASANGLINGLAPLYFDAHGQPTARTKISTVGTPSATASVVSGDTQRTLDDADESQSGSTNIGTLDRDAADSVASLNYAAVAAELLLDENMSVSAQSVGGFDDRMSDDGASSLVGFGEGAGSTISGPIYQRRQLSNLAAGALWGASAPPGGGSGGSVNGADDVAVESPGRFAERQAQAASANLLHQRVNSSHSLGDMASPSPSRGAQAPGATAAAAAAAAAATASMTHAAVLEWAQQPAATRRFKSSREAAESILRERRARGQHP